MNLAEVFPLAQEPEGYHVKGIAVIEQFLVAYGKRTEAGDAFIDHAQWSEHLRVVQSLLIAAGEEVARREERLEAIETDSYIGSGNFGAPPQGNNLAEREARRRQAVWDDAEHSKHWQARGYWRSRQGYLRALEERIRNDLRRYELIMGQGQRTHTGA